MECNRNAPSLVTNYLAFFEFVRLWLSGNKARAAFSATPPGFSDFRQWLILTTQREEMQAFREQVSVAPRYVAQQPSPRPVRSSPTRAPRANVSQSRVLSALAGMNMGAPPTEARPYVRRRPSRFQPLTSQPFSRAHSFLFPHNAGRQQSPSVNSAVLPPSRGAATLSTTPAMEPPPVPPLARGHVTHARVASAVSSGTNVAMSINPPDTKEPAPMEAPIEETVTAKPHYSYKDYKPESIMAYTRSVSEANDHLPILRGPLGFDMEWRVFFRRPPTARPTAVVQICDERYIWIIQLSAMRKCESLCCVQSPMSIN